MNKVKLFEFLSSLGLSLKPCGYDLSFGGFSWLIISIDGNIKYGEIIITNSFIENEYPNIPDELYKNVISFLNMRISELKK